MNAMIARDPSTPSPRGAALRRGILLTMAALLLSLSFAASARFFLSVNFAPPPLPVYEQPLIPGPGYIWTPGYWAYGDDGYFWVPGTWVQPPFVGALWTPGYWGWSNGAYAFNPGYWGPQVGFYGGVDYGYGYYGRGYEGGRWDHGEFNYNRAVNNLSGRDWRNVYDSPVRDRNEGYNRVSYNGGRGGVMARASASELEAARGRRAQPVAAQQQQMRMASQNRLLRASVNHGAPAIAATQRPGVFRGNGVVRAHSAGPATVTANRAAAASRPADVRTPHANARGRSQADLNARRSAAYAPRNRTMQGSAQTQHANAGSARGAPAGRSRPEGYPQQRSTPPQYQRQASRAPQQRQTSHVPQQRQASRAPQQPRQALRAPQQRQPSHAPQPQQRQASHAPQQQRQAHAPQRSEHGGGRGKNDDQRGHQH